jgi:AcrR family transcriptional regulator
MATAPTSKRRTRSDGERSRRAILEAATRLATVEGLEGLSIGRLAKEIGMSKSGLYAHFESKQDLQLATVAAAEEVIAAEVIAPASEAPEGLPRLEALYERYLSYVEREVFPGGCFFVSAATEWDTRPGPVRDRVVGTYAGWMELFEANVRKAQELGELDEDVDASQLTFEILALLDQANSLYVLFGDAALIERGRAGIAARLADAAGSRTGSTSTSAG